EAGRVVHVDFSDDVGRLGPLLSGGDARCADSERGYDEECRDGEWVCAHASLLILYRLTPTLPKGFLDARVNLGHGRPDQCQGAETQIVSLISPPDEPKFFRLFGTNRAPPEFRADEVIE